MGTPEVSTRPHEAGAHAQAEADRRWRRLLIVVIGSLAVASLAFVVFHGHGLALVETELIALLVMVVASAGLEASAGRWARGAAGERKVGATLEGLGPGWHVLHDIYLGRGNIDHIVVGPGGTFAVETKSHRGRISLDRLDERMLKQTYAEKKLLESISGLEVEALLVFSRAWLVGSVPARRRGVTVIPDRMLAGWLEHRRPRLRTEEADEIASRLRLALEVDAAAMS
ncbi:MAG TPA: nuclease-related domain-containing protein [Solirubrobacterales bacterium]|nr:nuclease-related domain-containing protein [Solirubrobacterales bacterium]